MNNNVSYQEKTEINGVFCPFINGSCRIDCAMFGGDAECALSRIHNLADVVSDTLEEIQEVNAGFMGLNQLIEGLENHYD